MPLEIDQRVQEYIRIHRVARLATVGSDQQPAAVPICYAFDGECFYTPIDEKPKKVDANALKRVRNIRANSRVAMVIDDYVEDWSKLGYVLVSGAAEIVEPGNDEHARATELLREKYQQYRSMAIDCRPIIRIKPVRVKIWFGGTKESEPDGE
jgi:PPOX class probable F420-dependent enzyme